MTTDNFSVVGWQKVVGKKRKMSESLTTKKRYSFNGPRACTSTADMILVRALCGCQCVERECNVLHERDLGTSQR